MNKVGNVSAGQQVSLEQGTDKPRGLENAALQRAKHDERKQEAMPNAVVVELGRSAAKAEAYAPPATRMESAGLDLQQKPTTTTNSNQRADSNATFSIGEDARVKINLHVKELAAEAAADSGTVVVGEGASLKMNVHADQVSGGNGGTLILEDGASLKMNVHAGKLEGNGGTLVVGKDASLKMDVHADTVVTGGSIVVSNGMEVKSRVMVDVLASATPGSPANPPPAAPALVPKEGKVSSLDAFAAVQTLQTKAVQQTNGRDEKEQAKSEGDEARQNEDPRWRLYREVLDSMTSKPGLHRALGHENGKDSSDSSASQGKLHVRN